MSLSTSNSILFIDKLIEQKKNRSYGIVYVGRNQPPGVEDIAE